MRIARSTTSSRTTFWEGLRKQGVYYLFLLPGLSLLVCFFYLPAFSSLYYSFFDWNGSQKIYVGLHNFRVMLKDPVLADGFHNLVYFLIGGLLISTIVPLAVAEFVFNLNSAQWKRFYQVAFLVTGLVPQVVVMLLWQFLYNPYFGPINGFLAWLGFDRMDFVWLADPRFAIPSLLLIGFPWVAGTSVLIFLAGLNTIPPAVIEASRIDGASTLRRVFQIDLFFVMGQVRFVVITGFIGLMQAFGFQLILTDGGPGTSTMVPGYYMYISAFRYDRLGYASAIGLVTAAIILVFTVLNLRYLRAENC